MIKKIKRSLSESETADRRVTLWVEFTWETRSWALVSSSLCCLLCISTRGSLLAGCRVLFRALFKGVYSGVNSGGQARGQGCGRVCSAQWQLIRCDQVLLELPWPPPLAQPVLCAASLLHPWWCALAKVVAKWHDNCKVLFNSSFCLLLPPSTLLLMESLLLEHPCLAASAAWQSSSSHFSLRWYPGFCCCPSASRNWKLGFGLRLFPF